MTLEDLIDKYDGTITFDVYRAIEGGVEEVITFSSEDKGAIKDDVLDSEVSKFSVDTSVTSRAVSLKVILNAAQEQIGG